MAQQADLLVTSLHRWLSVDRWFRILAVGMPRRARAGFDFTVENSHIVDLRMEIGVQKFLARRVSCGKEADLQLVPGIAGQMVEMFVLAFPVPFDVIGAVSPVHVPRVLDAADRQQRLLARILVGS